MTLLYAQPYNTSVEGFYFKTLERYQQKAAGLTDSFGQPVEEFEIQFIDGGQLAFELFGAWKPGQADIGRFFGAVEDWSEDETITAIIALREIGHRPREVIDDPCALDITLYRVFSLKELTEQFVDEGLFGEIPKPIENYIDHEAIARDLVNDGYAETIVAGERLIYRAE